MGVEGASVFWARSAAVAVGGALGAVARYWISGWVSRIAAPSLFPWGTLVVNVSGSFVLGLFIGATAFGRLALSPNLRVFVAIGLLGAFTTFSTFAYENLEALRVGDARAALLNIGASLVVALAVCWIGLELGQRM